MRDNFPEAISWISSRIAMTIIRSNISDFIKVSHEFMEFLQLLLEWFFRNLTHGLYCHRYSMVFQLVFLFFSSRELSLNIDYSSLMQSGSTITKKPLFSSFFVLFLETVVHCLSRFRWGSIWPNGWWKAELGSPTQSLREVGVVVSLREVMSARVLRRSGAGLEIVGGVDHCGRLDLWPMLS